MKLFNALAIFAALKTSVSATMVPKSIISRAVDPKSVPVDVMALLELPNGGYTVHRDHSTGELVVIANSVPTTNLSLISDPSTIVSKRNSYSECTGHSLPSWNDMVAASNNAANWCAANNVIWSGYIQWFSVNKSFFYVCAFDGNEYCYVNEVQSAVTVGNANCGTGQGSWEQFNIGNGPSRAYGYDPTGICECDNICGP